VWARAVEGEVVKKREERLDARPTARWREGVVIV